MSRIEKIDCSFLDAVKYEALVPAGYRFVYVDNTKQLERRLNWTDDGSVGNKEGFFPDGKQGLILLSRVDIIAWLTFDIPPFGSVDRLIVKQIQAARMHRELLPKHWCRILLNAVVVAAQSPAKKVYVRPARLSHWWHFPHGVAPEDRPALCRRLETYYDHMPKRLGFTVQSPKELDLIIGNFSHISPWNISSEAYHYMEL